MLTIIVPEKEFFDEETNEFYSSKETILRMEHSLVSISKWESKWKTPFLSKENKTVEQTRDYIRCMTTTQNVPEEVFYALTSENFNEIGAYIEDTHSATWFNDRSNRPTQEVITSELIYYWMVAYAIPWEAQKWHLNRLLTLIKICSIKNDSKNNKMSKRSIMKQNSALNKARRAKMGSKG